MNFHALTTLTAAARRLVRHRMIVLLIAIPLASIGMAATMLYLATSEPDRPVRGEAQQLDRTSWQRQP